MKQLEKTDKNSEAIIKHLEMELEETKRRLSDILEILYSATNILEDDVH